jgi:hypothetical protein
MAELGSYGAAFRPCSWAYVTFGIDAGVAVLNAAGCLVIVPSCESTRLPGGRQAVVEC